jgi:hypothetical protein
VQAMVVWEVCEASWVVIGEGGAESVVPSS